MAQVLRDYQEKGLNDLRAKVREGYSSAVLVAPTGAGKTTLAAAVIDGAQRLGRRIIFLAHRKELIDQCSKRLDEHGIDHGIIKAGNKRRNSLAVQVASIMTLVNRVQPKPKEGEQTAFLKPTYDADIFIIDECHRATASTYKKVLDMFPNSFRLGLTATPFRTDGRGLGDLFATIVQVSSPAELTRLGFLVPARVFSTPMLPDFDAMKHKAGEFDSKEVEQAMDKATLIGDIYAHWKKHAADRTTVIFASSRRHASHILETFAAAGEKIAYVDGETEESERDAALGMLADGRLQLIVNVGILTEGWDCPIVSCVVLARPTESCGLYLQMAGRALRPAPGKRDCIVLDHGGNTLRHGFVTDEREFDLAGNRKGAPSTLDSITTCQSCFAVYSNEDACPACGFVNEKKTAAAGGREDVKQVDGELQEINQEQLRAMEIKFFHEKLAEQQHRGYKPGYAKKCFFDKYGRWPGKEIGVKATWEEVGRDEKGERKFRSVGFKFGDIEVRT